MTPDATEFNGGIVARINIEDTLWADHRFLRLCVVLGDEVRASGSVVIAFRLAQKFWCPNKNLIPLSEWERTSIPSAFIEVGLAEVREGHVYVRGSEDQFAWLLQKHEAGKKGGNQKSINRLKVQEPVSSGGVAAPSGGVAAPSGVYPPTPTPTLPPTLSQKKNISLRASAEEGASRYTHSIPEEVTKEWTLTLKHYGLTGNEMRDLPPLIRAFQKSGDWNRVKNAVAGFRFEQKSKNYDPAANVFARRLEDPKKFDRLESLGEQGLAGRIVDGSSNAYTPEEWAKMFRTEGAS